MFRAPLALIAAGLAASPLLAAGPTFTMTGHPVYFHRHHVEVEGVPEAEQADYQSSWAGEIGLRIAGLAPGDYRVRLEYTEMDMNAPRTRVFDILLNGQVVKREACIFTTVGNFRVMALEFPASAKEGVITYDQRKSVRQADNPSFTLLRLYDAAGRQVARCSAHDLKPADWELRDYLDEIYHPPWPNDHTSPPWKGGYKLQAGEPGTLTAADVAGPDGLVYPDWTHVGIPGGIPNLPVALSAADYGLRPGVDTDSSAALQRAIDALQSRGGGVLFIPAGHYFLDRPVFVTADGRVLRGAGAARTRFTARFSMTGRLPEFPALKPGALIGPDTPLAVWVDPKGLSALAITANGAEVVTQKFPALWGAQVQTGLPGKLLLDKAGPGPCTLGLLATYRDGTSRQATLPAVLVARGAPQVRPPGPLGVFNFLGAGLQVAEKIPLVADGRRGDMVLRVARGAALKAGDRISLIGPETPRWDAILRTAVPKWSRGFRQNEYDVVSCANGTIRIPEALRIDFPVEDGSFIQVVHPLLRCGIEDLGLEQVVPTQVHGVVFTPGWECWARGLEIVHAGDKALYMPGSKRCEVLDCVLDRSWCNDGGSAYVGWETSFDCLMAHVTTYAMRHAPVLQWASSGNVIRSSVFHGSDMQWHAGWTNENLYEDLTVETAQTSGAYGNGGWASGPDDTAHGPNGPRNVVYKCSLSSTKTGLWLGGMNEGWIFAYNRIVVGRGPAVMAKDASFDHVFLGNVFVMLEPRPAAVFLQTPDCTGIEFRGNRFYGPVTTLYGGAVRPAVDEDSRIRESGGISPPSPAVRSIFEWEMAHSAQIRAAAQRRAALAIQAGSP
jgi:Pectate lyase superfamily protein/Malectin domain